MKPEVQAKFLQHLNRKNKDGGFTLIELLVVIIIIGILAAIALPSFLNQAQKGKQSEAKQYSGALNRGQQAYYLEKSSFTTDLDLLGVGIKSQTENYTYEILGDTATGVANNGTAIKPALKSYTGYVVTQTNTTTSDVLTVGALFESLSPTTTAAAAPSSTDVSTPPTGYTNVK